jgi:hypothetical protein
LSQQGELIWEKYPNGLPEDLADTPLSAPTLQLGNTLIKVILEKGATSLEKLLTDTRAVYPPLISLGNKDYQMAMLCLTLLGISTINHPFSLWKEALEFLRTMEDIILPPERRRAVLVMEPTGVALMDSKSVEAGKAIPWANSFMLLAKQPEARKFVGDWELAYAKALSHLTACELAKEWTRLFAVEKKSVRPIYTLSIYLLEEELGEKVHPVYFYQFHEAINKGEYLAVQEAIILMLARMNLLLEWSSRHYGLRSLGSAVRGLPDRIAPDMSYIIECFDHFGLVNKNTYVEFKGILLNVIASIQPEQVRRLLPMMAA